MSEEDKKPTEFTIIVNGRPRQVTGKKQSYQNIVALAYPNPDFDKFLYTVTYIKGEGDHEGDLIKGEDVTVKDGMVFNVRRSDKS